MVKFFGTDISASTASTMLIVMTIGTLLYIMWRYTGKDPLATLLPKTVAAAA